MGKSRVIIRDATVSDVNDLTLLINQLGYPTTAAEMENRFKAVTAHPDYKTIVAVLNKEVVGMAGLCKGIFYELNGNYLRILALVVKQTRRKQGIGEKLIEAAEAWATREGLNTIFVNSGNREERIAAHIFYPRMGYILKSSGYAKQIG